MESTHNPSKEQHMQAHTTFDGLHLEDGQYIAAVQIGGKRTQVFEVTHWLHGTKDNRFPGCTARMHTFGRRGGWVVHNEQVYTLQRDSIVILSEQVVEARGKAAYRRYRQLKGLS